MTSYLRKTDLLRVLMPGGIIFQRDLKRILNIARRLGNEELIFGSRQDIMFPAGNAGPETIDELFREIPLDYVWGNRTYQNIVTSYVAVDIMPTTPWVTAGTFHYVLEYFEHKPGFKVNIADPAQSLVPLFYGDLNFVASAHEDYWYLFFKSRKDGGLLRWPVLIYSPDIGPLSRRIEELADEEDLYQWTRESVDELFRQVTGERHLNNRTITSPLMLPTVPFPYYEGLNKTSGNKYWLGLYWRNNRYDISFLEKVCDLCAQTDTGRMVITPWKSFIIKDIEEADTYKWEYLCGVNGINFRHSSIELNWHLPVLDDDALKLKNHLVREFNRQDVSTYGLTFSVNTRPEEAFTSVVISNKPSTRLFGKYDLIKRYTVYYSKDFNPNEQSYTCYAVNIPKSKLDQVMVELSRYYFEKANLRDPSADIPAVEAADPREQESKRKVHQCSQCMTVYDKTMGDPPLEIPPGTRFDELPEWYCCPLCESPKEVFQPAVVEEEFRN